MCTLTTCELMKCLLSDCLHMYIVSIIFILNTKRLIYWILISIFFVHTFTYIFAYVAYCISHKHIILRSQFLLFYYYFLICFINSFVLFFLGLKFLFKPKGGTIGLGLFFPGLDFTVFLMDATSDSKWFKFEYKCVSES